MGDVVDGGWTWTENPKVVAKSSYNQDMLLLFLREERRGCIRL